MGVGGFYGKEIRYTIALALSNYTGVGFLFLAWRESCLTAAAVVAWVHVNSFPHFCRGREKLVKCPGQHERMTQTRAIFSSITSLQEEIHHAGVHKGGSENCSRFLHH